MIDSMTCQECGQLVEPASAFHPYLYCVLFKAGITDQEGALRAMGFVRQKEARRG